jgi:Outer membrane protein beta-barrel domain
MTKLTHAALAAAVFVGSAMIAGAQSTKGLFVGIQYAGSSLDVKSAAQKLDFGSGFGLHAGLGLSHNLSVLANFDRSVLTGNTTGASVTVSQYDALLRLSVLDAGSPVRVFVTAGATARSANAGRDFDEIAPTGGAGAQLFLSSKLALHGTALWTFGKLTQAGQISNSTPGQYESTQTRIQAGVSLYPFGH